MLILDAYIWILKEVDHHKMNFVRVFYVEYVDVLEIFVENYYFLMDYFFLEMENVQHISESYLDFDDFLIMMVPIEKRKFIYLC
jgi:hypothetical protein